MSTRKNRGNNLILANNNFKKMWYFFSRKPLNKIGLFIFSMVIFIAIFAPYIAPHPESAGDYYDFSKISRPPSSENWFGTDRMGRDIMSRIFFGYRVSLYLGSIVLLIAVPIGVILGLIAGYFSDTWIEVIIMRAVDVVIGLPAILTAMAVCSVLTPNITNAIFAVSLVWWTIYARMVYSKTRSLRLEFYVLSAEVIGASKVDILFREILPNCIPEIITKATLDMGWVILLGSTLSFVGLGAQPPTPDLGTMIAEGSNFIPDHWWLFVFPAVAIVIVILGFNLLGDGFGDMLTGEGK